MSITPTSTANGYTFLDQMMDKYATGGTTRLVQSFIADSAMGSFTDSVTYDDALVVDALLARGSADDLARAEGHRQRAALRPGQRRQPRTAGSAPPTRRPR